MRSVAFLFGVAFLHFSFSSSFLCLSICLNNVSHNKDASHYESLYQKGPAKKHRECICGEYSRPSRARLVASKQGKTRLGSVRLGSARLSKIRREREDKRVQFSASFSNLPLWVTNSNFQMLKGKEKGKLD